MKLLRAFLPAALTAVAAFAQLFSEYDGLSSNDQKAFIKNAFLIQDENFTLELNYSNYYAAGEYEFHGDLKLAMYAELDNFEIGFCITVDQFGAGDNRWDCFSNKIALQADSTEVTPCQAIDSYRDGQAGKRRPDTASAFRNDKAKNWQALFDYETDQCYTVARDPFLDALTVTSSFERMFQTDGRDQDVQFSSTTSEVKAIFGFIQFYSDADFTVASGSEIQGQIVTIKPLNQIYKDEMERLDRDGSIQAGNYGEAQDILETGTQIPMELDASEGDPIDLKMTVYTAVDEASRELLLRLKVIGRDIALPGQEMLIYATIEDPEAPGRTESVACSITLSKENPFVQAKNLWTMNYNGARSFKEGSDGVFEDQAKYMNEGDQVGVGKPWQTLMPDDGEDAEKYYYTFWEYSTEKFEEQTCTFKRKLGSKDLGEIRIETNTDYEVSVGVKLFFSKGSIGRQFEADSSEPYVMNIAYTKKDKRKRKPKKEIAEDDSARQLLVSLTTLVLFALAF